MSVLNALEDRMTRIFEGTPKAASPLPVKKLGKLLVKELKREALVIDGVDHAPQVYTILVNQLDEKTMAPLYREVTDELKNYISAAARTANLAMSGQPIVRFIGNSAIKPGKFEVIAESATASVLSQLAREEAEYIGGRIAPVELDSMSAEPSLGAVGPHSGTALGAAGIAGTAGAAGVGTAHELGTPARRGKRFATREDAVLQDEADEQTGPVLIDRDTKRTYPLDQDTIVIGRSSRDSDLTIRDPNISRRHCKLERISLAQSQAARWQITDLNSTNGTLINGVAVTTHTLLDGDVITLGVTKLELRL